MKTVNKSVLLVVLAMTWVGCTSSICDRDFYVEVSELEMLKEAEMLQCEDKLDWYSVAVFQLTDAQVRELLDSGDFEPVRSSVEMVNYPIRWVNKIFENVDQLSTSSFEYSKKVSGQLALKEDVKLLAVFITYPDWSGD